MKPPTVFLGEMTTLEVEEFLKHHHTVIIPVGATEQQGPHGQSGSQSQFLMALISFLERQAWGRLAGGERGSGAASWQSRSDQRPGP